MRWLVTGADGMLGRDLVAALEGTADVRGVDREDVDLTDAASVERVVTGAVGRGDVVVNCAAWTDVDGAEEHEDRATLVNGQGAENVARACARVGTRMVQLSTDYVFAGDATVAYPEGAPHSPLNAYGRSKMAGETAVRTVLPEDHLLVRTAWLYGAHGRCFPRTIAEAARARGSLNVVDDQVGQPTWTRDVVEVVRRLVAVGAPAGTYHATSSGKASWWEFAREVVSSAGLDPAIVAPTTSDAAVRPAARPAWSVLGHDALVSLGIEPIGDWRERWHTAAAEVLASVE